MFILFAKYTKISRCIDRCEEIKRIKSKGGQEADEFEGIEGNVDFFWCIPTDLMMQHLHKKLLRCAFKFASHRRQFPCSTQIVNVRQDILNMFTTELSFRLSNPELHNRIDRFLQVIVSSSPLFFFSSDGYLN